MKKLFATLSLAFAASTALAAGPVVGVSYDADRANGSSFDSHEVKVSVAQATRLGTVDAGLLLARFQGTGNDDANGFEVGYSNGLAIGRAGLKGRVAYGRLNQVDGNGGGFTGNTSYLSLGAEAATPVTTAVNAFVGYRHRNALNSDTPTQNRYTAGVDFALNKSVALRAGLAHTRQAGFSFNGITTAVAYNF